MADTSRRAKEKEPEFNPRWKGYVYILVSSLVNYASISNLEIEDNPGFHGHYQISLVFGITTFGLSVLVLLLDRFQSCCNISDEYNYTKAKDGKVEGYTLAAITFFWIVGVAHITQVDGIAYVATNIYFSSWLALFSCIFTLDKWSEAKDILSIDELTGLSATLKSWYVLFLASLVVMGTSCDMHQQLADQFKSSAAYGITLGLGSTLVALFFIFVHYRFVDFEFLQVGGWIELSASFCMILVWVVGVSILTSEGGIAATMGGSGCTEIATTFEYPEENNIEECFVTWTVLEEAEQQQDDDTTDPPKQSPPPKVPIQPTNARSKEEEETDQPSAIPTTTSAAEGKVSSAPSSSSLDESQSSSSIPSSSPSQSDDDNAVVFESNVTSSAPSLENPDSSGGESASSPAPSVLLEDESTTTTTQPEVTIGSDGSEPPLLSNATSPLAGQFNNSNNNNNNNNNTNLTLLPDDDDELLLDGDALLVEDDDIIAGLMMSNNNVTTNVSSLLNDSTFNFTINATSSSSNLTNIMEDDDPTTRWLQEAATTTTNNNNKNPGTVPAAAAAAAVLPTISSAMDSSPSSSSSKTSRTNRRSCNEILDQQIPGSNLYLACWICFFASFNVTLRWKAAQAIQFAQAQHRKADDRGLGLGGDEDLNASERGDNDGDGSDVSDSHTNDDKL